METAIFAAILVALLAEGLFIFSPMAQRIASERHAQDAALLKDLMEAGA